MDSGSQGRTRWDAVTDGSVTMPVNDHMGFVLEETGDPRNAVTFTWEVPEEYCNSVGNLQGGVLAAFADAVLGASSWAHMPADRYPALAEMKISIFRPAAKGSRLTGTGRVLKAGGRVIFVEAEITDDAGRLVAKASGTEIPIPE
jgi:uncharacterized protein (TIGR00369 family)